ncbi:MAG TPA: hypothetical protein VFD61_04515 [Gaiellales bacterium]|nr:hypothetical protein [Gaiellales bacterium]
MPEATEAAKVAAKDAALWWVRTHPLQAARFASVAARHPQRTRQAVSGAQTMREAAPDPRVRRLRAHLSGPVRRAGRDELADPLFWSEIAQVALAAAAAYTEARDRRARRARRRRAFLAAASLMLAGAAAYALRRREAP